MSIPKFAEKYINDKGIKQVEEAVKEVEKETSAELVPVIVESSSTTGHVWGILLLLFILILFVSDIHNLQKEYLGLGNYAYILYAVFVFVHVAILGRSKMIRRRLTPIADQDEQVEKRALLEFYQSNIKKTRDGTGILFYVSLLERKAIVIADESISKKLPPDTWKNVVDLMISGIKRGDLAHGMESAIKSSGTLLAPLFPIKSDDENELPNTLVIKE